MEAIIDGSLCLYAAVIIGLITAGYVAGTGLREPVQRCYAAMLTAGFFLMCCGTLTGLWQNRLSPGTLRFFQTMYVVLVYVVVILYAVYIRLLRFVIGIHGMGRDTIGLWICIAVSGFNILIWLIGLFSDHIFVMLLDDIGKRCTELWVILMIAVNVRFLFQNAGSLGKDNAMLLSFLTMMPMLGWLLQFIWPEHLFLAPMTGLALVLSFISIQRNQGIAMGKMLAAMEKDRLNIATAQLKPHFLYNCLSTIYMLCEEDAERAQSAVSVFSDLLRGTLDSINGSDTVPFSWEKKQIEDHLYMEKLRFGDKIQVTYQIGTEDFALPPLSVQSLVDNAVKHGIGRTKKHVSICITTEETQDGVTVTVQDDGEGFDPSVLEEMNSAADGKEERTHLGIAIVRERVSLICGGTLTVYSRPGEGTTASIFLPRKHQADRKDSL